MFALRVSAAAPDYVAVDAIFSKYCLDCHESKEPEAKLVLENYEGLMKGGENGVAIVPGKSSDSLLVKMVEGKIEQGWQDAGHAAEETQKTRP